MTVKTTLAMTKIVVGDLDASEAFYRSVCGFDQIDRVAGEGFREVIMRPSGDIGGAVLVLICDGSTPPPGEAVLVFETADVDSFSARVVDAGGEVTHPAEYLPDFGLTFALYRDPEGHAFEAIARRSG